MFKKLNMKGVSHHFLLPIMAVLVIAGIGGYVMQRSSSAMTEVGNSGDSATTVKHTVKAMVNGAGKTCKQNTYALNSKNTCVSYAQKAMGISADGVFSKKVQVTLKKQTGSTVLNSASWAKLCAKIQFKQPVLYGKAGCNGKSYTYAAPRVYGACMSYKYTQGRIDTTGIPISKPTVKCTTKKMFSTLAEANKANAAAKSKAAYQTYLKDLRIYNAAKK